MTKNISSNFFPQLSTGFTYNVLNITHSIMMDEIPLIVSHSKSINIIQIFANVSEMGK